MRVGKGKRKSDCENVQDVTYKEEKKSLSEACEWTLCIEHVRTQRMGGGIGEESDTVFYRV